RLEDVAGRNSGSRVRLNRMLIVGGGNMRKSIFLIWVVLLSLCPAAISQTAKPAEKVVTSAQVNGTWRFQRNTFKVLALGNQRLRLEFQGTYEYKTPSGMMANTGEASGIATIEGDTALFKPDGTDDKCKITLRFTKGKLI